MKIRLTNDAEFIIVQANGYLALGELETFLGGLTDNDFSVIENEIEWQYFTNDESFAQYFAVPKHGIDSPKLEAEMNAFFQANERAAKIVMNTLEADSPDDEIEAL